MWSERDHFNFSRDTPNDSSISSYSSSAIQQMLKINIGRPKQSNTAGFSGHSTKYNSSYHKLKETRASDILQTLQKFDKKYVNFDRVEHNDSSLSSLGKLSIENLPFTTKTVESDTDLSERKPMLYSVDKFGNKPTVFDKSKITGKIQINVSADLMTTKKNTSKVHSHLSDYGHISSPRQKSQTNAVQDCKSEISAAEEISNESVKSKPQLKVTVQAKNQSKRQSENDSCVATSESRIKTLSDGEIADKAPYSNNEQKYHQRDHFDYLNALKIKSDYNESKVNSSSTSTIHTEPSASIGSSENTQKKKHLGTSSPKTQQNELKMLPFKVLTLDDLMDESQLSSKSKHNSPSRDFQEVKENVKQKSIVKDTFSNLVSAKQNRRQQETDEDIDEILEDSESHNNISMDSNRSISNKSEEKHSSVRIYIKSKNIQLESFGSASNSSKKSILSEDSKELVSVKQSFSKAAKSETEVSSNNYIANNSNSQEESVKNLGPQELKLPKTFYSVSSQTDANRHETINQNSIAPGLLPDKALYFSQGTQTNINSQSLLASLQQSDHHHENESTLDQISTNIILNEVLKQQIKLTKHLIENQQRIHSVYLTTVNQLSANFKPVTLENTEEYIKANLQKRLL